MQTTGASRNYIYAELKKQRALDKHYEDGRILCSMCTKPHPVAEKAYKIFFSSNIGDSGLFPGSVQLEKEVIEQLSNLLHGSNSAGFIVSGGTEANLMALLSARSRGHSEKPEVILAESAHFSFYKICQMLNIKPIYASLTSDFSVNTTEVRRLVNKNTIAIVGTAGTSEVGTIDPIEELAEIACAHNVWLHVDAAFGGLVIPFLKVPKPFDFEIKGVSSITVDPHKMGMAAIPAGGILFRDNKMLDALKTETPYLSDKAQYTFVGTRTGAATASAWAVMRFLGRNGYQRIVRSCMKNTEKLASGLQDCGLKLVVKPTLNIVAFRACDTKSLAQKLWDQGWFVSYVPRYDCIRLVIMPHVKNKHIDAFLIDTKITEKL